MVLEVTAKDQDGRTLFSEHRTYQEIGVDIERRMQFGAWLIKEIIDFNNHTFPNCNSFYYNLSLNFYSVYFSINLYFASRS